MSPVQYWMGHSCLTKGPSLPAVTNALRANTPLFQYRTLLVSLGSIFPQIFDLVNPHHLFSYPILWRILKIFYLAIFVIFSKIIQITWIPMTGNRNSSLYSCSSITSLVYFDVDVLGTGVLFSSTNTSSFLNFTIVLFSFYILIFYVPHVLFTSSETPFFKKYSISFFCLPNWVYFFIINFKCYFILFQFSQTHLQYFWQHFLLKLCLTVFFLMCLFSLFCFHCSLPYPFWALPAWLWSLTFVL